MAGQNIGDDRVWLHSDTYYDYVSDRPECGPDAVAYVSVAAIEDALKVLDRSLSVERRGAAYLVREKLGILPSDIETT